MQRVKGWLATLWPRQAMLKAEPGAALFRHLRLQLTLWYSVVLACALLIFSAALYFGVQQMLYSPVGHSLPLQASSLVDLWQHHPDSTCSPPPGPEHQPPALRDTFRDANSISYITCYNAQLQAIQSSRDTLPSSFVNDNGLVSQVRQTGKARSGIISNSGPEGRIYGYAAPVFDRQTHALLGVVLVGRPLGEIDNALNTLLTLLVIGGVVVLLGAGVGGLFLANRALVPTRLAFSRQQRFIGDASHELRTPLTFLCANTEILLDSRERLDPDDVSLLEEIYTEANHMNVLASNMLTLARLDVEQNPQHYEHDIVDLNKLAGSITRQGQALARKKGVTLQSMLADEPIHVIGDPVLLEQAALVLLDNALKYNHSGGSVTITTSVVQEKAALIVRDTGIGIAPENLARLGERFYRVDKARSRAIGGTGLGLSIAHSIARNHHGSLLIESTPGMGTTVMLSLPALPESASKKHAPSTASAFPG